MLALLIEDVTLTKQRDITAAVRFRAGATTTLTLPRPLTAQQLRATHPDVRQQIDTLLDEYTDAQVAHVLNERGLAHRRRRRLRCDAASSGSASPRSFRASRSGLLAAGMLTAKQLGERSASNARRIGRWRSRAHPGSHLQRPGEWLYWFRSRFPRIGKTSLQSRRANPLHEVQYERRSFDIDMQHCPNCGGGELKIIAAILERPVIEKILTHLGLDPQPPPGRGARAGTASRGLSSSCLETHSATGRQYRLRMRNRAVLRAVSARRLSTSRGTLTRRLLIAS